MIADVGSSPTVSIVSGNWLNRTTCVCTRWMRVYLHCKTLRSMYLSKKGDWLTLVLFLYTQNEEEVSRLSGKRVFVFLSGVCDVGYIGKQYPDSETTRLFKDSTVNVHSLPGADVIVEDPYFQRFMFTTDLDKFKRLISRVDK